MSRLPGASPGGGCQASGHEADHGPLDHRFGVFREAFVVAAEAAAAHQPGQRSFHHPAARQYLEGALPFGFAQSAEPVLAGWGIDTDGKALFVGPAIRPLMGIAAKRWGVTTSPTPSVCSS